MANQELNLLINLAGRRVELIQLFRKHAAVLGIDLQVTVTDSAARNTVPAAAFADEFVQAPLIGADHYLEFMQSLIERQGIDIVVPTIDPDLEQMAILSKTMAATSQCKFIVSSEEAIAICRDKLETMRVLSENGIVTPRTCRGDKFDPSDDSWDWPLIFKPRGGSSSVGIQEYHSNDDQLQSDMHKGNIVQEKISGKEFTVNSFVSDSNHILYTIPHLRKATRSGEVSKGVTRKLDGIDELSRKVAESLPGLRGPFCYQAIQDKTGKLNFFEINGRFGGGYPLADQAGANGIEAILKQKLGMTVESIQDWHGELAMLRYDQSVFTTNE